MTRSGDRDNVEEFELGDLIIVLEDIDDPFSNPFPLSVRAGELGMIVKIVNRDNQSDGYYLCFEIFFSSHGVLKLWPAEFRKVHSDHEK